VSSASPPRRALAAVRGLPPKVAAAAAVVLVLLVVLLVVLLRGGGGEGPPPVDAAARLVPADALVYAHLSTDGSREGTAKALKMARAFPGFGDARASLVKRLSAPQCGVKLDVIKGKEAALALLDAGAGTAGSLVLVDTGTDQSKAPLRTCGTVQVLGIGTFLAVGQPQSLALAQQLGKGTGRSLAADPGYREATAGLPAGRVLDAWVTAPGVRRLLAPQGGLLGAAGTLLDQPGLRGSAMALTATDGGARVTVKSLLSGKAGSGSKPLAPTLDHDVPGDAVAYLGLSGLTTATTRLLSASGAGGVTALTPLLQRAQTELAKQSGGRLDRDLLSLFRREVAVAITPAVPAPTLSIIARTDDAEATAETLKRLQGPLARVLGTAGRPAPVWKAVDGAFQLKPAAGIEIDYAVFGDELVLSTKLAGIQAARKPAGRLSDTAAYKTAMGGTQGSAATSLVFLDFSQLLRLGEQTGLNDSKTYLAAKADLQRVRAIGARSSSDGRQSTAELFFTIP
jgi:Protein of unknown function (DUF3352)